jgi:hypothetical protein
MLSACLLFVLLTLKTFAVQQADYTQADYRVVNLPFNPYSSSELSLYSGRVSITADGNMDNALYFFFVGNISIENHIQFSTPDSNRLPIIQFVA